MTTTGEHPPTTHPSSDEVVARLKTMNRDKVAERVAYLLSLDGDDPSEKPIEITCLRDFAQMIEDNWKLPDPRISANPVGQISIEWFLEPPGIVAMTFETNGIVRFYAAFDEPDGQPGCAPISSTLGTSEALVAVQRFLHHPPPR